MFSNLKISKRIALLLALLIAVETFAPSVAFALTSGPTQPEFTSFEPVSTANMVDPFTGAFAYNLPVVEIPGPNGGGYAMSLSYHSGAKMEDDASWVGYGWTLNPGAVNRSKRGIPDDVKNGRVTYHHDVPADNTVSGGYGVGIELTSMQLGLNLKKGRTFNSYRGVGHLVSVGVSFFDGLSSIDYSVSEDGHSYSASLNIGAKLFKGKKHQMRSAAAYAERTATGDNKSAMYRQERRRQKANKTVSKMSSMASSYGMHFMSADSRPTTVAQYEGFSVSVSGGMTLNALPIDFGPELSLWGNVSSKVYDKDYERGVYGYMYSGDALSATATDRVMDYSVERENHYNKRDQYLAIPFASYDQYAISGEGLAGSFRLHSNKVGHFYPTETSSETDIVSAGVDLGVGASITLAGFNFGGQTNVSSIQKWEDWDGASPGTSMLNYQYASYNSNTETHFMRFSGDQGGNLFYSSGDWAYRPYLQNYKDATGTYRAHPAYSTTNLFTTVSTSSSPGNGERVGRSSYVGFHTNREMKDSDDGNVFYQSYTRDPELLGEGTSTDFDFRENTFYKDHIGEIATYNEAGNRYVYGRPVYGGGEGAMSYNLENGEDQGDAMFNEMIFRTSILNDNSKRIVGEEHNYSYVTTYLLTEITTPDYIDRDFNGPSDSDFGGWTKFEYEKTENEFHWRLPFGGMKYERGTIADTRDDVASEQYGQKELHFLKYIETATHIAFFVTNKHTGGNIIKVPFIDPATGVADYIDLVGSGVTRPDAAGVSQSSSVDPAEDESPADATQDQPMLEQIIVYAKDKNQPFREGNIPRVTGKPLKVVHLEYNNSLCPDVPNNINADPEYTSLTPTVSPNSGKLTLEKVWFEYEGIVNTSTAPYVFSYEYKHATDFSSALQTRYSDIVQHGAGFNQNPSYHPADVDSWGEYKENGRDRRANMTPWVSQKDRSSTYDPAVWQLKQIKLPSGGEILVQYEEHDYAYVQEKQAMSLVSLMPGPGLTDVKTELNGENKYYINPADLGITATSSTEVNKLRLLTKEYIESQGRVYFKFLYGLIQGSSLDIENTDINYIKGYAKAEVSPTVIVVDNVGGQDVYSFSISFKDNTSTPPTTVPGYTGQGSKQQIYFPRQVCLDFRAREVGGLNIEADPKHEMFTDLSIIDAFEGNVSATDAANLIKSMDDNKDAFKDVSGTSCLEMLLSKSYLKIPTLYAKKGGGIRVKRVLMYDEGLETGDEVLYGSEYIYKNPDGTSSGVASWEPLESREEIPHVRFLSARAPQTVAEKIISGVDHEQFEDPLGESLMPAAYIGYSTVVVQNIHKGTSAPGYTMYNYLTYQNSQPYFIDPLTHNGPSVNFATESNGGQGFLPVGVIPFIQIGRDNRWNRQGYSFVMHDLHGKLKRVATYGGVYAPSSSTPAVNNVLTYEETYEYLNPGQQVKVLKPDGSIAMDYLGRDEDISIESKIVGDNTRGGPSIQFDANMGNLFVPLIFLSMIPYLNKNEKNLYTHVTSKVIHYTCPLISKTVYKDGIRHTTRNEVFSSFTGEPVVTTETDEFDGVKNSGTDLNGLYANYSIPASYVYPGTGPKSINENFGTNFSSDITVTPLSGLKYTCTFTPTDKINILDKNLLISGDLIRLYTGANADVYFVESINKTTRVVTLQRASSAVPPVLSTYESLKILRSGYSNQLKLQAGGMVTYGVTPGASPLTVSGSTFKQSSFTNVISSSAAVYENQWFNTTVDVAYNLTSENDMDKNDFLAGRMGKWRLKSSYALKAPLVNGAGPDMSATERNYAGGYISSFTGFDYNAPSSANSWIKATEVNMYSPHGNALQEQNALGIKSTAKFGYGESVPVLIAHNASYGSVVFDGFETGADNGQPSHSGSGARLMNDIYEYALIYTEEELSKGILVRAWVKTANGSTVTPTGYEYQPQLNVNGEMLKTSNKVIARVGEWMLVENSFTSLTAVPGDNYVYVYLAGGGLWVDDFRVQPMEAEMSCYVYDQKTLRVVAIFDEQHFGMMYQYNAEGQLVRKLVETEKGVKTITEAQYNTAK